MSSCNAYRSFLISWVIVCAIIESTRGFTIPRTANITEETDLTGEESSVLTVRHESKTPNDIHNYDNSKNASKEKSTFETKENSQEISTDRLTSKVGEFTAGTIFALDDFNRKLINSKDKKDFNFTQYTKEPSETFQSPSEFTTSRDDNPYNTTPILLSETPHSQRDNSNISNNGEVTKIADTSLTSPKFMPSNNISNSTITHEITTPIYDINDLKSYTLANELKTITLSIDELYSLKDLASSITETVPSETATTDSSNVTYTYLNSQSSPTVSIQRPDLKTASTKNKNMKDETINYYNSTAISPKLGTETIDAGNSNIITTDASTSAVTTEALWKKYITLERKRVTTDASTATEFDLLNKAETSQTTISSDRTLNQNPTTPFDKFTDDINNINNKLLTTIKDYSTVTEQDYTHYEFTTPKTSSKPTKIGIVSSKMAGFLDFSKISSRNVPTVQKYEDDANKNDSELSTTSENTTEDTTTPENKSTKVTETQRQLADDAINEELLKEESLNDNEDAKRHRVGRLDMINDLKEVKPFAAEVVNINNLAYNQTDDTLVQPINHDKLKNTILYAVNSKYKPMKKIDIQPPKQFVRNPDDNSWRNESINSLGIVYKPKNSSKSFIQVLKNKTEIELNNLANRDNKGGVLDLRQRLEKIAEVRKSKKKKTNKYGDSVYVDYEEGNASAEVAGLQKENNTAKISFMDAIFTTTPNTTDVSIQTEKNIQLLKGTNASTDEIDDFFKRFELDALTTDKPKKYANVGEYYDTTDEYDVDYLNISNIDLKKHTWPITKVTTVPTTPQTPASVYAPERQPTVQYFPPTTKKVKVNVNDYDDGFKNKVNIYTVEALPKDLRKALSPAPFVTMVTPPPQKEKIEEIKSTLSGFQPSNFNNNLYFTNNARVTEPHNAFVNEPDFNRGSYVIKHYKDFINVAAKDDDYRNEYMTFTDSPVKGITINEFLKENGEKAAQDDYDYEQQFRKDLLNRFVANFNKNNERFKVDFPILFNNSVVHKQLDENGRVLAESTAFMKRLYDTATIKPNPYVLSKPCDPNCDKITVELSPAYELHYYVPEQEEKEEAEQPPVTVAYRQYRSKLD